jgi:hypothetical protein
VLRGFVIDASTDLRASLGLCSPSLPATSLAVGRQPYSPRGRQTCLHAGNVSSEMTLGGEQQSGGNYGSRSFALVDRYTPPDHPSYLGVRWASLMTAPIQFIVLKYKGKWSIKSRDLQRSFPCNGKQWMPPSSLQMKPERKGSLRWFYSKNRKPSFRRFGHTARAPIPRSDRICPQCRGRLSRQNWRTPPVKAITLARNAR